jgi:hypothetical protein
VDIKGKVIMVTIKADQSVDLKLKGNRNGTLNISIEDLWEYLGGEAPVKGEGLVAIKKAAPQKGDNKMISLYDLRSANAIGDLDYGEMARFDGIINDMIKNLK